MKYNAFISYRHAPLDMEIAKKLHKALETFHIPISVRKRTGKKRINRVFRDQEELPIGSDLNDNISNALKESEYLIVICSPDTPGSYWVLKEIETFIELHDREHVLAILIDGEPWTSFPAPLLTDAEGNPVEPLAADIRGANSKERNKKFKSEFLRLAAPLIGCTYDDLRQRHKERIIRRNITIGIGAAAALGLFGAIFGVYNAITASKMKKLAEEKAELANEKTQLAGEIYKELQDKQINQSKFYAEKSLTLLSCGYRDDAALVAMNGLPSAEEERPYVSRAEYALSMALRTYDDGSTYDYDRVLSHKTNISLMETSEDGTKLVVTDSTYVVYVWDTTSFHLLAEIPPETGEDSLMPTVDAAQADSDYIYVGTSKGLLKYNYDGTIAGRYDGEPEYCCIDTEKMQALLTDNNKFIVVDLKTMKETYSEETGGFLGGNLFSMKGTDYFVLPHGNLDVEGKNSVEVVNAKDCSCKTVTISNRTINKLIQSSKDSFIVVSDNEESFINTKAVITVERYDLEGNLLWRRDFDNSNPAYDLYYNIRQQDYTDGDISGSQVIFTINSDVHTMDTQTGETITDFTSASVITSILYSTGSTNGYLTHRNGSIEFVDFATGKYRPEYNITLNHSVREVCVANSYLFIRPEVSSEIPVICRHDATDRKELTNVDGDYFMVGLSPDESYFVLQDSRDNYYFYNTDGELLYNTQASARLRSSANSHLFLDEFFIIIANDKILYINPLEKKTEEVIPEEIDLSLAGDVYTKSGSRYLLTEVVNEFYVYDLRERKTLYHSEKFNNIRASLISPDGKTIYYLEYTGVLSSLNIENGNIRTLDEIDRINNAFYDSKFMCMSESGKYLAVQCADGQTRIIDTSTGTVKKTFEYCATIRPYMEFINHDKAILLQKDDLTICIWNLETESFSEYITAYSSISSVYSDEEQELYSITNSNGLYFINTADYGLLAEVPKGVAFLKNNNSFLVLAYRQLSAIPYKDYTALIEDVKNQFPEAELTPEKRTRYNID